ncbi:hypothetical protein QTP86_022076, partial [Hemibagrus guttatus]
NNLKEPNQSGFKSAHSTLSFWLSLRSYMMLDQPSCHLSSSSLTFLQHLTQLSTVCKAAEHHLRHHREQQRGSSGDSPVSLSTLYTSNFRHGSHFCHLQKFSDDSTIVGCIRRGQEAEYSVVDSFVEWCGRNHLQLNISKTKELVVDFRKQKPPPSPISIMGDEVDIVDNYKYLGIHIDNKLEWTKNTDALYKKGQSRLYFRNKLRSLNVCRTMLQVFCHLVVASIIFYAVVCWGNGSA